MAISSFCLLRAAGTKFICLVLWARARLLQWKFVCCSFCHMGRQYGSTVELEPACILHFGNFIFLPSEALKSFISFSRRERGHCNGNLFLPIFSYRPPICPDANSQSNIKRGEKDYTLGKAFIQMPAEPHGLSVLFSHFIEAAAMYFLPWLKPTNPIGN